MAERIVNWHINGKPDNMAYYMEQDYAPHAVRIHAQTPAKGNSLKIDIKADGVSILGTYAELHEDETLLVDATEGEFNDCIEEGEILTCEVVESNGANNVTVQLELDALG